MELLDTTMVPLPESETELLSELKRCIQIGLLCVQETPGDRPAMSAVVVMLTSTESKIDLPRRLPVDNGGAVPSNSSSGHDTDLSSPTTSDLT